MCIIVGLTSQSRHTSNYIINTFGFRLLCGISIIEIVISFLGILLINLSGLLCCLEKKSREQGGSPFPYLSPEPRGYTVGTPPQLFQNWHSRGGVGKFFLERGDKTEKGGWS